MQVRLATLVAFLFALVAPSAQAATILQVDVSDPSAVVFTATAAVAENNVVDADSNNGILLTGFFTGNSGTLDDPGQGALPVLNGGFGGTRTALDRIFVGNLGLATTLDLNIFSSGGGGFLMSFLDTDPAVNGLLEGDLSVGGITGLPTPGASGNVYAGGLESVNIIGQWEVVPEPGTALLMGLGLAGLGAAGRSRRDESKATT